jgi:hypothetical protein
VTYQLFTYADPNNDLTFDSKETIDLGNLTDEHKSLLQEWFPVDYAKAILDGVRKLRIQLGIGKRANEIVKRWQEGHPWLPETITISKPGDPNTKLTLETADAAPMTQDTLRSEVRKQKELAFPELTLGNDKIQFEARPAWKHPERTEEYFAEITGTVKLDGCDAYKSRNMDVDVLKQFSGFFGDAFQAVMPNLNNNDFTLDPSFAGLCCAWYVVDVQTKDDVPKDQKGSRTNPLKMRIPVGLIKPMEADKPDPILVRFDEDRAQVYTPGLDFRFICFEEVVTSAQFSSSALWLKTLFLNRKEFSNQKRFFESLRWDKFKTPVNNLKLLDTEPWRSAEGDPRIVEARKLAPNIVGKGSLAVFADDGIHLLENEKQIGAWCAKNKLLDRLFQPPPWSSQAKWLDEKTARVWSGNSWTPTTRNWPGGKQALEDEVLASEGEPEIPSAISVARQLASALGSSDEGINGNRNQWNEWRELWSIREFRKLDSIGQFEVINKLWDILTTAYPFDQQPRDMFEPEYDSRLEYRKTIPLPTSWCPKPESPSEYYQRAKGKKWNQLGVGFRIEGGWAELSDTLGRLDKNGMTQWRQNKELMAKMSGFYIEGTQIGKELDKVRFWNGNYDILNQTAVCVSRNFFGATAFPERKSQGEYVLFALDCYNLKGFDTEKKQMEHGKQWRPGEKAFQQIPFKNVIGWVCIRRCGCDPGGGWEFEIGQNVKWNYN